MVEENFQQNYTITDDVTTWNTTSPFLGGRNERAIDDPQKDYLEAFRKTSPLQHAIAVTFFFTFGVVGNSIVIHIYRRKAANYVGNLYLILIAVVDIFACCVTLPFYPFLEYLHSDPFLIALRKLFFLLENLIRMTYFYILLIMAIERYLAVFRPFTFRQIRRKMQHIALGIYFFEVGHCLLITFNVTPFSVALVLGLFTFGCVIMMIGTMLSYVAISIKLVKMSHKQPKIKPIQHTNSTNFSNSDATKEPTNASNHSREAVSVKLAVALFIMMIICLTPLTFSFAFENFHLAYICYINHIANPWVYFIINPTFRSDVRNMFKVRLTCHLHCLDSLTVGL